MMLFLCFVWLCVLAICCATNGMAVGMGVMLIGAAMHHPASVAVGALFALLAMPSGGDGHGGQQRHA